MANTTVPSGMASILQENLRFFKKVKNEDFGLTAPDKAMFENSGFRPTVTQTPLSGVSSQPLQPLAPPPTSGLSAPLLLDPMIYPQTL